MMRVNILPRTEPTVKMARYMIVVRRDQIDLWRSLVQDFAEYKGVHVRLNRRRGERRRSIKAHYPERRMADRRRLSGIEKELLNHPYVIVPAQPES